MTERIEIYFVGDFDPFVFGMQGTLTNANALPIKSIPIIEVDMDARVYAIRVIPIEECIDIGIFNGRYKAIASRSVPIIYTIPIDPSIKAMANAPNSESLSSNVESIFNTVIGATSPKAESTKSIVSFKEDIKGEVYTPHSEVASFKLRNTFGLARRVILSKNQYINVSLPFEYGMRTMLILPSSNNIVSDDVIVKAAMGYAQVSLTAPYYTTFSLNQKLGFNSTAEMISIESASVRIAASYESSCRVSLASVAYLSKYGDDTLDDLNDTELLNMNYILK